ncbi:hypothetical protein D9758_010490 [Tetrapyrgos nigripes]|uniref:ubiquitinyl hydrolase 1 n=1 Tax=Tetrapyrgos nigripes TaxID=182062 RepID=A0A8H5CZV0_9AGAR|nr:hypothetical protein D9758_010490 [Tetrapyrgos nigripes]
MDNNGHPGPDLVGGPFAVIESDPGVFTSLTRKLGIKNIDFVELYDIEPWAVDHLKNLHGLILCFHYAKDSHRPADFEDPAAERVWFANQLSDDACATLAILNVVFNCPSLDIGPTLESFKTETSQMSSVIKGLAISSSSYIRNAHNSFARPADLRGALNTISITTLNAHAAAQKKAKQKAKESEKPPPKKRGRKPKEKTSTEKSAKNKPEDSSKNEEEAYHFIGYVPAHGKVWELDGFKSGPLEVGELANAHAGSSGVLDSSPSSSRLPDAPPAFLSTQGWMDVVRPALRMKMQKYGSSIRFSLLALVSGTYERANDEWEYWRRDRVVLERRLDEVDPGNWRSKVDPNNLLGAAEHAFTHPLSQSRIFAADFASRRNKRDMSILTMSAVGELCSEWEETVKNVVKAKVDLEDELSRAKRDHSEHLKRTHDYEPFLAEFVRCLENEDLLDDLLDLRFGGRKKASQNKDGSRGPAKKKMRGLDADDDDSKYKNDDEDWEEGSEEMIDKDDDDWKPNRR